MAKREYIYDGLTDTLGIKTTYDASDLIEQNKAERAEGRQYLGSKGQRMLKVASIDMDHIEALKNMGYNLLSPDPDEVRRALLYVQAMENESWMLVDGKPIAEKKQTWV